MGAHLRMEYPHCPQWRNFGGAADNENDHNDGAAQTLSPAAPHTTNGAIYAASAKQSARTAAVADGEGDATVMNC